MTEIIVADDDAAIRYVLNEALSDEGWTVLEAENTTELKQLVRSGKGDTVITDVLMPGGNGLDAVSELILDYPTLPFIIVSAQNTLSTAMESNKRGAFNYIPKPFDINEIINSVKSALESSARHKIALTPAKNISGVTLIGRSAAMQSVYRTMARVVATDLTILIDGESGTGKELVARALHDHSKRRESEFVAINMAALPKELIESELFGHEKGAFTGAASKSIGRFGQAKGGTLFLDEIGDMPLEAQTRLLRVLQEGEYHSIGSSKLEKTDVRIIAATNKDLSQLVRDGQFREDLYFRLNVVPITMPALRNRSSDIPELIDHFNSMNITSGLDSKNYTASAYTVLENHSWPGNIRELENLIQRIAVLYHEDDISGDMIQEQLFANMKIEKPLTTVEDIVSTASNDSELTSVKDENIHHTMKRHLESYFNQHSETSLPPRGVYAAIINEVEIPLLEKVLELTAGNQLKAAEILGLNRNTLRKKIKELGIVIKK